MDTIRLARTGPDDIAAIEALYPAAFPDEDLLPLVHSLLALDHGVLSLAAWSDGTLAGHIMFTRCGVQEGGQQVALLAPLAVEPDYQRRGVGSKLVREGISRMTAGGATATLVLGDPAYYSRFGFQPERDVLPPYPMPKEWASAWQSVYPDHCPDSIKGVLSVPTPWHDPTLWGA